MTAARSALARAQALADPLEAAGFGDAARKLRTAGLCNSLGDALEWCLEVLAPVEHADARAAVAEIDEVLRPWRDGEPEELPALEAARDAVRDEASFERFVDVLVLDLDRNGIWWANDDLRSYLSALGRAARGELPWLDLALLLDRARVYE